MPSNPAKQDAFRRPTLRDVAARANVSIKTVSNVANGYRHVSAPTRTRVQQAIAELGYRPNMAARSLRSGRSNIVALAVPFLDMPYFAEIARYVVQAAAEQGWTVLIDQTDGNHERERLAVAGIREHLIDGLIVSPLTLTPEDLAQRVDATPLVLLGERIHHGPTDHVLIDNVAAAREASLHLVAIGRKRIAAIGAQQVDPGFTAQLRLQGWHEALERSGLPAGADQVEFAETWRRAEGTTAMARLLDAALPPDAVFCFNDLLALGALRELNRRGIRVPDDIAVVGFDDIDDGRFSTPTLTTVAPDKAAIARTAIDLVAHRLSDEAGPSPQEVFAPYRLIERESTRGPMADLEGEGDGALAPEPTPTLDPR
jgi:DNA-binding LacI/PurR family transcriptional regulator